MSLHDVLFLAAPQAVVVARQVYRCAQLEEDPFQGRLSLAYLLAQADLRREIKRLDELYERRTWELTRGELNGDWWQCAAAHDCYSEDPKADGWRMETFLGRDVWLCSFACVQAWRERESKKMETVSRRIEVGMEGGKKVLVRTPGRSGLDGTLHPGGIVSL